MITIEQSRQEMKTMFQKETGRQPTGVVLGLLSAVANANKDIYTALEFFSKNSYLETADRDHLFLHSGELVPYNLATKATAVINVYGNEGTEIEAGTEVKDDNNNNYLIKNTFIIQKYDIKSSIPFIVLNKDDDNKIYLSSFVYPEYPNLIPITLNGTPRILEYKLVDEVYRYYVDYDKDVADLLDADLNPVNIDSLEIFYSKVYIEAVEAKKIENELTLSDNLQFSSLEIAEITDIKILTFENGSDIEDEEDYRIRVRNFLKPKSGFSKNNLISKLLELIPELKFISLKGNDNITESNPAKYIFYCLDISNSFSNELKDKVLKILNIMKPVGIENSVYDSQAMTIQYIKIKIENFKPINSELLKNEVRRNLVSFLDQNNFEKPILKSDLYRVVSDSQYGGLKPLTFDITEGEQSDYKQNTIFFLQNGVEDITIE